MPEDLRLAGVLETVQYDAAEQQDEMERFYENVLGLESLGLGRWSLAFRLGQGVVLLFDRERSLTEEEPPPHGALTHLPQSATTPGAQASVRSKGSFSPGQASDACQRYTRQIGVVWNLFPAMRRTRREHYVTGSR